VLALGLPPDLTWNEFQTHYADAVGTRDTKIQERARYFQLYKAFDREEGECMDMILRAKREQVLAF
jgi:transposase-like protein